jgi:hypothetical protein
MSSRTLLRSGIKLVSSLALLVAVMTSPIRPALSNRHTSRPDFLRRNFGIPRSTPSRFDSKSITAAPVRFKALLNEGEEEEVVELARLASSVPSSDFPSHPTPARDAIVPLASQGALRPLRC